MSAFLPVACQHCRKGKIGEIVTGLARFKCPHCRRRTTAGVSIDGELHYISVDKPLTQMHNLVNIA